MVHSKETAARRQVLALAAHAVEQRLNADTSDHAGPFLDCECGHAARYAGRRIKVVQSILGELKLDRAYYHCPLCSIGTRLKRTLAGANSIIALRCCRLSGRSEDFRERRNDPIAA
jgi:hypothetical protein